MARFRYTLQAVLDDARHRERGALLALARARAAREGEEAALRSLCDQARVTRAELTRGRPCLGGLYVEVGLRLAALAAARRERQGRLEHGARTVAEAAGEVAQLAARRKAIERDRERKLERFLAAEALREAGDYEESNATRGGAVHESEIGR